MVAQNMAKTKHHMARCLFCFVFACVFFFHIVARLKSSARTGREAIPVGGPAAALLRLRSWGAAQVAEIFFEHMHLR